MNETAAVSQPGASLLPEGTGTITTIHLVLILLVAAAAIAIIVAGVIRKRRRDQARKDVQIRAEAAGVTEPSTTPVELPRRAPPSPESVRPIEPVPSFDRRPTPDTTPVPAPVATTPSTPTPLDDEPIAAAAPLDANPAATAADASLASATALSDEPDPAPATAIPSPADGPVTQLKGLGPKVATRFAELGITRIGQIAALDENSAQALDAQLGAFSGRMARDRWIEQARFLAAGDRAGFEAVFGKLGER